jgi:hypothetical protein
MQLLTPFLGVNHSTRTVVVLSAQGRTVRGQGPDGPRPGAGQGFSACRPDGPRPGAAQEAVKVAGGAWISLSGGTPSGRRDPRSCLGSGRPT